jgi:hypothetical protein
LLRLAEAVPVLAWVLSLARWLLLLDAVAALGGLAVEWPLLLLGPAAALVPFAGIGLPVVARVGLAAVASGSVVALAGTGSAAT